MGLMGETVRSWLLPLLLLVTFAAQPALAVGTERSELSCVGTVSGTTTVTTEAELTCTITFKSAAGNAIDADGSNFAAPDSGNPAACLDGVTCGTPSAFTVQEPGGDGTVSYTHLTLPTKA